MSNKNIVDFANQIKTYMRGAEVVEGKNLLSDDEFSAVIKGFKLNIAGTTKSYDATTKTLEVVTVATDNSGVYISGTNFSNYINASSLTYPCVLSFFVKANKNCLLRGFMLGVSDTNLVADTWTQIYATFNNASALNNEFHIYAHDTTAPTIQFKEMMICSEADWNKSHTYEPYYVPVKDRDNTIDVTSEFEYASGISEIASTRIVKSGKTINGQMRFNTPSTSSDGPTIMTVPTKYAPKIGIMANDLFLLSALNETWTGNNVGLLVWHDNKIKIGGSVWGTNKNVFVSFSYEIE